MSQQDQVTKKLDKLARMVLAGVSQVQIAAANGLTEGRISQILDTEEYKKQEEVVAAEKFEEMELINQGWDGVEALGVQNVLNALQTTHDPDFALRAAAVANKASRRGGRNGSPDIQAQNAGGRAIIHLKATFVESLQQNFMIQDSQVEHVFDKQKDSDFMPAKDVQVLLGKKSEIGSTRNTDVEQAISGFGVMQEIGQEI